MSQVIFKRKLSKHIKVILINIILIFGSIIIIYNDLNDFRLVKVLLGILGFTTFSILLLVYLIVNRNSIVFIVNEDGFIDNTKFGFGCITWNNVQKIDYESHYSFKFLVIQTKNTEDLFKIFKERKVKRIYKRYLRNHIIYISLEFFEESPEEVVKIMQDYLNIYNGKN